MISHRRLHRYALPALAVGSGGLYAVLLWLSSRFTYEQPFRQRPVLAALAVLAAAFAIYLLAMAVCRRAPADRRLLAWIYGSSLAFRLILLPSVPILEIDIYRYIWDGAVQSRGVSPFRYSPHQILSAPPWIAEPRDLAELVDLKEGDPALGTILRRVHYGKLPTVYPPVSQAVFAAAFRTTPAGASLHTYVLVMKAWLVVFDLATLLLVSWLLRTTGQHPGLCVIYGWCPLVIKEIANGGHLDAIAIFFATLSLCLLSRLWHACGAARQAGAGQGGDRRPPLLPALEAALALAVGVGAKLYPVVLAPLLAAAFLRCLGWRGVLPCALFAIAATGLLWPMRPTAGDGGGQAGAVMRDGMQPPTVAEAGSGTATDPSRGITVFLSRWEMNDFLFLLLIENLKTGQAGRENRPVWFSVTPEGWREAIASRIRSHLQLDGRQAAFLVARALTATAFVLVALWLARSIWPAGPAGSLPAWRRLLEAAFLTIAWFWLLSPTQNPWYWAWALPLLPFARGRAWLAMSGLVLLYYLRFWLSYWFSDTTILGTPYNGYVFFDLVVSWFEFGPWFLWLILAWVLRQKTQAASATSSP